MHPSHRYSFRYSYRYPEVGLNTNPCTLQSRIPTRSVSTQPPNLDSTRMAPVSARSFPLPFFTLDFSLDSVHLKKTQRPTIRQLLP